MLAKEKHLEDSVDPTGLEPVTSSMSRKHSNQLSYGSIVCLSKIV